MQFYITYDTGIHQTSLCDSLLLLFMYTSMIYVHSMLIIARQVLTNECVTNDSVLCL